MAKQKISPTQRMLNTWAIVLIIWSVFRAHFKTELPIWIDEFIAKPLIFLTPIIYYIRNIELKPILPALGFYSKHWKMDTFLGFFVGGAFFISAALANYLKYNSVLSPDPNFLNSFPLIMLIAIALVSAISEELLMRGFVLKRLYEESNNALSAAFFTSVLYFFMHVPMLFTSNEITGYLILQVMATDLVMSLAVSALFIARRNVLLAILVHFFYNLSLYIFL